MKDLEDAVFQKLCTQSQMQHMKAHLRATIHEILSKDIPRLNQPPSEHISDINRKIAEYLNYCGYKHSLSVFVEESNTKEPSSTQKSNFPVLLRIHTSLNSTG